MAMFQKWLLGDELGKHGVIFVRGDMVMEIIQRENVRLVQKQTLNHEFSFPYVGTSKTSAKMAILVAGFNSLV